MFGRPEALSEVFHELSARPFANLGDALNTWRGFFEPGVKADTRNEVESIFHRLDERTSPQHLAIYIEH